MLSNKLTFSLVLVLMLALVAGPVLAQEVSENLNPPTDRDDDAAGFQGIAKEEFTLYQRNGGGIDSNGISGITPAASLVSGGASPTDPVIEMPDLYELLRLGGTIELAIRVGPKGSEMHTVVSDADVDSADASVSPAGISAGAAAGAAYKLLITEVMWGLDRSQETETNSPTDRAQWIEIYNNAGAGLKIGDDVRFIYTRNIRQNRIGTTVSFDIDNAVTGDETFVVVDQLSTINRFGGAWGLKGNSGNTVTIGEGTTSIPPTDLASMYRNVTLDGGKYKADAKAIIINQRTGVEQKPGLAGLGHGAEEASWSASIARVNMTGFFIGSPGAVHTTIGGIAGLTKGFGKLPATLAATGLIINEVRNDPSGANLDWIELYHFDDAVTAVPQNIENWTLSVVTVAKDPAKVEVDDPYPYYTADADDKKKHFKDTNLFSLPKFKLLPGEYLVVYNRHPGETILAGGVNVEDVLDGKQVNKGSSHLYIVREGWSLPSDMKFLVLLRNNHEKAGTHEKIVDYAGNGFFKRVETNKFNTDIWPLIGWSVPADQDAADAGGDNTFASASQSFGRNAELNDKGMWRPMSRVDNRTHKDDWAAMDFMGTGYDRDVDPKAAPGSPGYENRAVSVVYDDREGALTEGGTAKSAYLFGGTVTISEVMYDAGPRWNLVQWIELYNSSMTETVNLEGWTLEIRNKEDVESYVDSSFEFEAGAEVLPNQTLLIVSGTGANDVDSTRVYNLYEHHRRELGLLARDSVLLSRTGFYLRLTSKIMVNGRELSVENDLSAAEMDLILMDEAGNVSVDGAKREAVWSLPARDPAARQSLVRRYGNAEIDGNGPYPADDGIMDTSWSQSDLTGAGLSYYGHRNDIGTPGFRLGGALPVTLSSFRPIRNQVTGHVDITWVTESELNNAGFNILRSEGKGHAFEVINVKGIVAGHGTTSEKHVYKFTDTTAKPNVVYYYQIEDVSLDGKRTTLRSTHLRGNVSAAGKEIKTWGDLKLQR